MPQSDTIYLPPEQDFGSGLSGGFSGGMNNMLQQFLMQYAKNRALGAMGGGSGGSSGTFPAFDAFNMFGSAGDASGGAGAGGSSGFSGLGGLGLPALFAAMIAGGKTLEKNNANNPLGQGLLAGLGPSFSQVSKDPIGMGLPTLFGLPFLTPFTSSQKSQDTKPEWSGILSQIFKGL